MSVKGSWSRVKDGKKFRKNHEGIKWDNPKQKSQRKSGYKRDKAKPADYTE